MFVGVVILLSSTHALFLRLFSGLDLPCMISVAGAGTASHLRGCTLMYSSEECCCGKEGRVICPCLFDSSIKNGVGDRPLSPRPFPSTATPKRVIRSPHIPPCLPITTASSTTSPPGARTTRYDLLPSFSLFYEMSSHTLSSASFVTVRVTTGIIASARTETTATTTATGKNVPCILRGLVSASHGISTAMAATTTRIPTAPSTTTAVMDTAATRHLTGRHARTSTLRNKRG